MRVVGVVHAPTRELLTDRPEWAQTLGSPLPDRNLTTTIESDDEFVQMPDSRSLPMTTTDIARFLGSPPPAGRTAAGQLEIADAVDDGLSPEALDRVKEALELTDAELARILGVSPKTVHRIRSTPGRRIASTASDRLYRTARLYLLAAEVLEDADAARDWLRSPQLGLDGRVPLDLLSTDAGSREIEALLVRIEHGVLS